MKFINTEIEGVLIVEPRVFEDERGYFFESFQSQRFASGGITDVFVQDNEACSSAGVIRGLHYQCGADAQSKLVRVIRGKVFDVAVDIRPGSPTYGKWVGVELSAENKRQLYVPRGMAHGYLSLEEGTILCYKCDNYYTRDAEGGIRYDDPQIGIVWPWKGAAVVSEKDLNLPYFGAHRAP